MTLYSLQYISINQVIILTNQSSNNTWHISVKTRKFIMFLWCTVWSVWSKGTVLCVLLPIIARNVFVHISRKTCNMSLDLSYLFSVTVNDIAPTGNVEGRLSFTHSRHRGWLLFNPKIAFFLLALSSCAFNQNHFLSPLCFFPPSFPQRENDYPQAFCPHWITKLVQDRLIICHWCVWKRQLWSTDSSQQTNVMMNVRMKEKIWSRCCLFCW